ncbi:MAG TPA: class I SAM-dependent methyltransferase [Mycobacterium sp.]|nr:class I SAM-dependent methyltransferase [Mycobacterium sp.]
MTAVMGSEAVNAPRPVTPSSILAAELAALSRACYGILPPDLARRLREARDLAAGLDPYLERCTTPESPALADLARRTRQTDWRSAPFAASPTGLEQEMLSGHVEGQVLKFLVHMCGARRVLEIGMFTGYSTLAMAEALSDDGVVIACELDGDVARFARDQFDATPAGRRVHVEVGPAMTTLQRLVAHKVPPFDLVFVDADKAGYLSYVDFLLDNPLLTPGAVIAVDNTLLQGQPWTGGETTPNGAAIASFNAAVAADPRVEQVVLPLRDGLTLIRRADDRGSS